MDPACCEEGAIRRADYADTASLLEACLGRLGAALRRHVQPGSGLLDPDHGGATAADHYGQTAAALALDLLEREDPGAWRVPLAAWQALPARATGHAPFNRFLLELLAQTLEAHGAGDERVREVRKAAARCRLRRRYPSNNWSLLAGLCRVVEADGAGRAQAADRLRGQFERWLTPAGGFVDYPAHPGAPARGATPITYHHKALFVAVVARETAGGDAWDDIVGRLLHWSLQTWDGYGHAGGFGRSTHALFGDACLLAALILLGAADEAARDSPPAQLLRGVLHRWDGQFRADDFLALNPADATAPGCGRDGYMHLSVYNAWAAAIVAWARERAGRPLRPPPAIGAAPSADPDVLRLGQPDGLLALIAARGQPPQAFSRREVELRYAGGVPFHLTWKGRVLSPAPVRVPAADLQARPALAGWTPLFLVDGELYGLTDLEPAGVEHLRDALRVTFHGFPCRLLRPSPRGVPGRLAAAIDWRLLGGAVGRHAALNRRALEELRATVVLTLWHRVAHLRQEIHLEHQGRGRITYLNPGGHALTGVAAPQREYRVGPCVTAPGAGDTGSGWWEATMPSAILGAAGYCRAPLELAPGIFRAMLELRWSVER